MVQYKATCDLCTLWQRFGRAARSPAVQGVGILLVEKKNTSHGREKGLKRGIQNSNDGPRKRQRCSKTTHSTIKEEAGDSIDVDSSCQLDTLPSIHAPSQAAWLRDCQERYTKPEVTPKDPTNAKKGRLPGVLPGTAMDDYINIPTYISCRRLVPQLYFRNDNRSKSFSSFFSCVCVTSNIVSDGHHRCDPVALHGCDRCQPRAKTICCDLCHQQSFEDFHIRNAHLLKTATVVRRSVIPASYKRTAYHSTLEDALYEWREDRAVERFGEGLAGHLGAQMFMTEDILSRIIDCWACKKITETSQLYRETSWPGHFIQAYGQSLMDLLATYPPFDVQRAAPFQAPPPLLTPSPPFNKNSSSIPPLALPATPEVKYPGPSHVPGINVMPCPTVCQLPTPPPTQVLPVSIPHIIQPNDIPFNTPLPTFVTAVHTPSIRLAPLSISPPSPVIFSTPVTDTPNIALTASSWLPHNSGLAVPHQRRKRAPIRCGNCLQVGHNRTFASLNIFTF